MNSNQPKTTDELLRALPRQTYNCEPFSLMLMPHNGGKEWTGRYFTFYSKKSDDRIPMMKGKSVNSVLKKMHAHFKKNLPEALNKNWQK